MSKTQRRTLPDRLARAAVGGLLVLAGYVMLADFINLRRAQEASQAAPVPLSELALPQPWGGYGWRALSRLAGNASRTDPATAQAVLSDAGRRYPLDAVQWLDLARIHARDGEAEPVDAYLARAGAVQPYERRSLWAAAQVALQTGNAELAERQLRQWLRLYPRDTGQALFIGRRWIDDPGTLLDRMLPEGRDYLAEAMEVARRQTDIPLAEAVWARLSPKPGLDDSLFLNFVDLLLQTGAVPRAVDLWAERDPNFQPGRLVNGDFSRPMGEPLALNWRVSRPPPGVRVERDTGEAVSGPASLKINFNGKENVNLGEPWIRIPVEPGQHYRLSGAWRAEALTTRSLPYWYLTAEQGNLRARQAVPGGSFSWARWQIEFQAPQEAQLVRLQLRRDRTDAFDRNIDGTLWLDDFRLEPIAEPQTLQSAASEALGREASVKGTVSGIGEKATVDGLRLTVDAGKEQPVGRGSIPDGEQRVGRGSIPDGEQRVGRGSIPDGGNPTEKQADRKASLARQAPTPVEGSEPTAPPTTSEPSNQPTSEPANQPTSEPATGVGAGLAGDGSGSDPDSLARQAPTPVEGSEPTAGLESGSEISTGVGAGLAGEDRGPETRITSASAATADSDAPARKPSTVKRLPAPQALETVNRQPAPQALEPGNRKPARSAQ